MNEDLRKQLSELKDISTTAIEAFSKVASSRCDRYFLPHNSDIGLCKNTRGIFYPCMPCNCREL
jgi:hypothetical protein